MQIEDYDLRYAFMDLQNELHLINQTLKQLVTTIEELKNDRFREE